MENYLSTLKRWYGLAYQRDCVNQMSPHWSGVKSTCSVKVAWIHPDQAKAKKAIRLQIGKHDRYVFTHKSNPVLKAGGNAWKKALGRASIANFRWHDLRHTWASWHVQAGTPLNVFQELGGWSDYSIALRYAHLAPEHLAEYASNILHT